MRPAAAPARRQLRLTLLRPARLHPPAAVVELPDGEGKAIATENCQACHKLTNITKAHKSLDDWKETVQTMIDRGANVPADQVDTLVQYLAKNFGPKDASAPPPSRPRRNNIRTAPRNAIPARWAPRSARLELRDFQAWLAPVLCPCENYDSTVCANRSRGM